MNKEFNSVIKNTMYDENEACFASGSMPEMAVKND